MMLKDVDLVLDLAEERRLVLPVHPRTCGSCSSATAESGHADEDFMALYLQLRDRGRRIHRER